MIQPGRYVATPTFCSFGYTKQKGTPYVRVTFQIDGAKAPDDVVDWAEMEAAAKAIDGAARPEGGGAG